MKLTIPTTKEVHVWPCIRCGSDDINIYDCGYSSFNPGGGKCKRCGYAVTSKDVGCLPKMETLVGIWNSENDPNKLITSKMKLVEQKQGEIKILKGEIRKLQKRINA